MRLNFRKVSLGTDHYEYLWVSVRLRWLCKGYVRMEGDSRRDGFSGMALVSVFRVSSVQEWGLRTGLGWILMDPPSSCPRVLRVFIDCWLRFRHCST